MKGIGKYIVLILAIAIYSCVGVLTRMAADYPFLSWSYVLLICGAMAVMGFYAIIWQQILKHVELSTAYMFKGTSLIFIMLLAWALFGEQITTYNIIGACVIIVGIALYAKA